MNRFMTIVALAALAASSVANADEAEVQALQKQCEAAREAKLKPLRDAEIARCKSEPKSDASYCERYWSDYGDAKRLPNGTMQPRLFDDLHECIDAEDARRKLRRGE
jgi:hypothetical protein